MILFFLSSDDIATKVLSDNDEYLGYPSSEGFVMNIALKSSEAEDDEGLAIAALRIQVGKSSTARVPSNIIVEGRRIPTKKGVNEWYAVVLTAQEIALSMRKGFVTVKIDRNHFPPNSLVVDCIEVYAIPRSKIASWTKAENYRSIFLSDEKEMQQIERIQQATESLRKLACIGDDTSKAMLDEEFLRFLVFETAIGCTNPINESVVALTKCFDESLKDRNSQAFIDSTRVKACFDFVKAAPPEPDSLHSGDACFMRYERFLLQMEDCLRLCCSIAKNRPEGYLKAMKANRNILGSIALPASGLFDNIHLQRIVSDGVVTQLTELCLTEMAISGGSARQAEINHFAALQRLLQSRNRRILTAACRSVQHFCKRFQTPETLGDEPDPFAAQSMIAVYGCDSCSAIPIKGTRYTLTKDHHSFDLCEKCYASVLKFASSNKFRKGRHVLVNGKPVGDEGAKLCCSEVRSMQAIPDQNNSRGASRGEVYEEFLGNLFLSVVALFSDEIKLRGFIETDIIRLAADLVRLSEKDCRLERKKRFAKKVVDGLSQFVSAHDTGPRARDSVIECIQSLSSLVVSDFGAREYFNSPKNTALESPSISKGDGDFVCELHNCPLELRRFCPNVQEGKQFVTCKSDRCGSFAWVNSSPEEAAANVQHIFDSDGSRVVWDLFTSKSKGGSLVDVFCQLVEQGCSKKPDADAEIAPSFFPYTFEQATDDVSDGIMLSLARTRNTSISQFLQRMQTLPKAGENNVSETRNLLDVSLELVSLTAPVKAESLPKLHPLLCKMIEADCALSRKNLAKTALFRLCGADHDTYHRVRDYFTFAHHTERLLNHCQGLMSDALLLKQRSHACGSNWRVPQQFSLQGTNGFDFLGINNLLDEGVISRHDTEAIKTSLDDILVVARRRSRNWIAFCSTSLDSLKERNINLPPLSLISSLAIILNGEIQIKSMKLCELASVSLESSISTLSALDVFLSFSYQFVLYGKHSELRRLACSVGKQLVRDLGREDAQIAFPKFIPILENAVGETGKNSAEFLTLLSFMSQFLEGDARLNEYAFRIQRYLLEQVSRVRHHRANEDCLILEARSHSSQRKRFDVAYCAHCNRTQANIASGTTDSPERRAKSTTILRVDGSARRSSRGISQGSGTKGHWVEGQVSAFKRERLHSLRETYASDEFATYIGLKNRMVRNRFFFHINGGDLVLKRFADHWRM